MLDRRSDSRFRGNDAKRCGPARGRTAGLGSCYAPLLAVLLCLAAAPVFAQEPPPTRSLDLGGGVRLALVWVAPGTFTMGTPTEEMGDDDEQPQHEVTLSRGFWLGRFEVTNAEFRCFRPGHDSGSLWSQDLNGKRQPAVEVSQQDAVAFCRWLSERCGETVTLPTEAQWEYACRAETRTATPWGQLDDTAGEHANVADRSAEKVWESWVVSRTEDGFAPSAPVGSFPPNPRGLHDMIGNVWEWCRDTYAPGYYAESPERDPVNTGPGKTKVLRGGSYGAFPWANRAGERASAHPARKNNQIGFRVVIEGE